MAKKMNINLSIKFLPPILLVTLLATSVGAYFVFNDVQDATAKNIDKARESLIVEQSSAEKAQIAALKSKSDVIGNFMAKTAPDFILSYDFTALLAFQQEAAKDSDVAYTAFLKPSGEAMTEYKAPKDKSTILEKRYPIIFDDEDLGFVLIGMSKAFLVKSAKESNQRIDSAISDVSALGEKALGQFKKVGGLTIGVLMIAISISLFLMFRVFVITPLHKLKESAHALSHGDLEQKIDTSSGDELGSLANSFSDMRDSIRKKIDDLSILNLTGDVLAGVHSQNKALETAIGVLHEQMNVVSGSVYLYDEDTKELAVSSFYPDKEELHTHKPRNFKLGEGITGKVAQDRKVIYVPDVTTEETYVISERPDEAKALISIPMIDEDKLFGVMNLSGKVGEVIFDSSLQDFAENIARMTVVTVKNIQMLEVIEEQNRTLEQKVEARTAELAQKTNDINNMLQNMHQGIFTVTVDGKVHPEYSAYLESILEHGNIAGEQLMDLLFSNTTLGSNALDQIKTALGAILGEDEMMFDFNKHCLVPEFSMVMPDQNEKILELDWDPMIDENETIEKLMVTVRDVTDLRGLQAEAEKQKAELEVIGQILAVSESKFVEFIKSGFEFVDENEKLIIESTGFDADAVALMFRNMHTIKGNARTYGFSGITDTVHETEQTYDDLRKADNPEWDKDVLLKELYEVKELLKGYNTIYEGKLKSANNEGVFMDEKLIGIIHHVLGDVDTTNMEHSAEAIERMKVIISAIGTESIETIIENILSSIPEMAETLGKKAPKIVINDNNYRLSADIAPVLRNVLTHAFRNSVDHGLESPEERSGSGKNEEGTITLVMEQHDHGIMMKLFDDGRGLALERIKQKAIDNDIISADDDISDDKLASLIFHSGFSTAEEVSDVSGRGVGMDAVKRFMTSIGGDIEIHLTEGTADANGFRQFESCILIPEEFAKQVV